MFVYEKDTVENLSKKYSDEIGASPKDWVKQNRALCGFFGSTNKIVPQHTNFMIPTKIVVEANQIFIESLSSASTR